MIEQFIVSKYLIFNSNKYTPNHPYLWRRLLSFKWLLFTFFLVVIVAVTPLAALHSPQLVFIISPDCVKTELPVVTGDCWLSGTPKHWSCWLGVLLLFVPWWQIFVPSFLPWPGWQWQLGYMQLGEVGVVWFIFEFLQQQHSPVCCTGSSAIVFISIPAPNLIDWGGSLLRDCNFDACDNSND